MDFMFQAFQDQEYIMSILPDHTVDFLFVRLTDFYSTKGCWVTKSAVGLSTFQKVYSVAFGTPRWIFCKQSY